MNNGKRRIAIGLACLLTLMALMGCKQTTDKSGQSTNPQSGQAVQPKYIFLFIGDGMSYAQTQAAALYLGSQQSDITTKHLSFMDFGTTGTIETYDALAYCPDSASTGTAISSGHRTESTRIGMDTEGKVKYESIAEQLKREKGFKIGIVSTVYLNHATPAAFYAHQQNRNMYYEIGLDMISSGFDYFGGGGLTDQDKGGTAENLYNLAKTAGYSIARTVPEAEALKPVNGKSIVVPPEIDKDTITVPYLMDATDADWPLENYVQKGIEMIDNEKGFFMMVESGKIDWACHANDSNAAVSEVLALDNAVKVALGFYQKHPNETLILVTGDHETGGMSLGYAATEYKLYPQYLQRQTMSFTKFNHDNIPMYKQNKTAFETVLDDIEKVFGLIAPSRATGTSDKNLVMTSSEYQELKSAYELTLQNKTNKADYGSYEPLTATANKILNHHIGIGFSSYVHTAAPLPIYAIGPGAQSFMGVYHGSGIHERLLKLMSLQAQ